MWVDRSKSEGNTKSFLMKNRLFIFIGALSLCLALGDLFGTESSEKGSSSSVKVYIKPQRPPKPPKPPKPPIICTGQCRSVEQTHAEIFLSGQAVTVEGPNNSDIIPFDSLGLHSSNILPTEFNPTTHTLRIPVGKYNVRFQSIMTESIYPQSPENFSIEKIYLEVSNNDGFSNNLPLKWVLADRTSKSDTQTISYFGETLLEIKDPNGKATKVDIRLLFERTNETSPTIIYIWDPQSQENSPANLVLTKIGEISSG
jgi:hypothetical protein